MVLLCFSSIFMISINNSAKFQWKFQESGLENFANNQEIILFRFIQLLRSASTTHSTNANSYDGLSRLPLRCFSVVEYPPTSAPWSIFWHFLHSVLWRCWLGSSRKGIKTEWWGAGVVICLGRGADLHMNQLMPLPLTLCCSRKSTLVLVLSYWYRLTRIVRTKSTEL